MGKSSLHHVTQWESPAVKQKVRDTIPITDLFQRKKLKTKFDIIIIIIISFIASKMNSIKNLTFLAKG